MALEFGTDGLLPPGVHDADWAAAEAVLAGTPRRRELFATLRRYAGELAAAIPGCVLLLNGSFVMLAVDEPGDIDFVLVLPSGWPSGKVVPLSSPSHVERRFGFHVLPAIAGDPTATTFAELFQLIAPKWYNRFGFRQGTRKGLVRVTP